LIRQEVLDHFDVLLDLFLEFREAHLELAEAAGELR
jgi:hypothetical protein